MSLNWKCAKNSRKSILFFAETSSTRLGWRVLASKGLTSLSENKLQCIQFHFSRSTDWRQFLTSRFVTVLALQPIFGQTDRQTNRHKQMKKDCKSLLTSKRSWNCFGTHLNSGKLCFALSPADRVSRFEAMSFLWGQSVEVSQPEKDAVLGHLILPDIDLLKIR